MGELVLGGGMLNAADAERAGLVSRVVPEGQAKDEAVKLATQMAAFSSPVLQLAKECVNASEEVSLAEGLKFERNLFHATWALQDREEGMRAFIEKRDPVWKHR